MDNDIHTVPLARKLNRARKGERKKLKGNRGISLGNWRESQKKGGMMTETDRIMDCVKFNLMQVGYVDIALAEKMLNIPAMIVENVLKQNGMKESGIKGQWIKDKNVEK